MLIFAIQNAAYSQTSDADAKVVAVLAPNEADQISCVLKLHVASHKVLTFRRVYGDREPQ